MKRGYRTRKRKRNRKAINRRALINKIRSRQRNRKARSVSSAISVLRSRHRGRPGKRSRRRHIREASKYAPRAAGAAAKRDKRRGLI